MNIIGNIMAHLSRQRKHIVVYRIICYYSLNIIGVMQVVCLIISIRLAIMKIPMTMAEPK
jgi:hypothetical protein